jgi:uncharacterized protein YdhG (YjbR/CyaY superfamily)
MATAKKQTQANKIRAHAAQYPNKTIKEIADKLGLTYQAVYQVLKIKPNVKTPKKTFAWRHVTVAPKNDSVEKAALEAKQIFELTKGRDRTAKPIPLGNIEPLGQKFLNATKSVDMDAATPLADNVNHPAHYKVGGIETIDFIEAKGLNYHLGNVVKYITRADSKGNREEDLLKARWYLNREIAKFSK